MNSCELVTLISAVASSISQNKTSEEIALIARSIFGNFVPQFSSERNPDYFSAAQSSIVNAINLIYKKNLDVDKKVTTFGNKISDTVGDTANREMAEKFENLKALMGSSTIIEGLEDLYKNKLVVKDNLTETVKTIVSEQTQSIVEQTVDEKLSWTDNIEE